MLLLNGCSAKDHGHDIVKFYSEVKAIAGQLLPDSLQQPQHLQIDHWFEQTAEDFVIHLFQEGDADTDQIRPNFRLRNSSRQLSS